MRHFSFPDIGQFRQAIRAVQYKTRCIGKDEAGDPIFDGTIPLPTLKYRGTIKMHGTNSSICKNILTGEKSVQSRERIISIDNDNYGFARFVDGIDVEKLFATVIVPECMEKPEDTDRDNTIIIYGEWCGGSIQKNVALTQLNKMFVVFAVQYCGVWLHEDNVRKVKLPEANVYNILDYESYTMDIDFNNPELSQNKLIDITVAVETECPIGKSFGVSGVGEGVVYKPIDSLWSNERFWFKVKGEKHSVTKTKQLASVDIEKVNSINELMDNVVTENRIMQGFDLLKLQKGLNFDKSKIGDLIRWVYNDVLKEESDTISASGLDSKEIGGAVAKRAKDFIFKNLL